MNQNFVERAKEIYDRRMTSEQISFTQDWWKKLVRDETKLIAWLCKLYGSEIHGVHEYLGFMRFKPDHAVCTQLRSLANDEMNHATMIDQWMAQYDLPQPSVIHSSKYWNEMQRHVKDFSSACAIKFYGETLASERFEILRDHPDTPDDLFHLFRRIGLDEQRHSQVMYLLSGPEAIVKMERHHIAALQNLINKAS